ncbi:hypothetical protein [Paraglaciecola arctica]|uniref:Lipoprotein n=1 Tax=Paraglaciecola arctica BSs20135 TaxID=493475 RepID=K6YLG1_9ALTE|nr:hypothetical protein [Paraglaciecola arctica]GAC17468.1 hypothetical protein GARC_0486 [Paraglaciecola arctica BSs20135]
MITAQFRQLTIALLFSLVALLSSCAEVSKQQSDASNVLNQAAEQYVKLGLELGEYDKDYVDAYLGPDEWKKQAKAQLRSKQQLASDISQLLQKLENLEVAKPDLKLRHKALFRNVRAMDVRARMLVGESFTFAEEARLIYDTNIPQYDFAKFDQALNEIDKLVPGEGDLAERVDTFRSRFAIAEEKVSEVVNLAIAECKKRSDNYIFLPNNERFELEYVTDKSWSGYNWYQGDNKSLMQINQDFPMQIDRAIGLGCHEGYPGHHVWNVLIENNLLGKNGWVEYSIFPLFSPYALIAEGSANYGVDLAFPEDQKVIFERDVLFPIAGLDPATAETLEQLNKLTAQLSHAITATAQLYLNAEISREQAIEQRRKYSLVSQQRAEQSVRFIEQYRAYVLNYNLGKDIVSAYISKQSKDEAGKWQAFERMLTELSTASDMMN